jgi:hypothetical protein
MPDENEWSPAEIMSIRIQEIRIGMGVRIQPDGIGLRGKRMVFNMCSNQICSGLTVRGWAHRIQDAVRELLAKLLATQMCCSR